MRTSLASCLAFVSLLSLAPQLRAGTERDVADLCFEKLVGRSRVRLDFDVFEPRGLALHKGLFYLSAVEILEPSEPVEGGWAPGKGRGHLLVFNGHGELLEDLSLGWGDRYHPGGLACDGQRLWIPVAENRPDSRTTVFTMDLANRRLERAFEVPDHLALLAADPERRILYAYSWGSLARSVFSATGRLLGEYPVRNAWLAYSAAAVLPGGQILAAGSRSYRTSDRDRETGTEVRLAGLSLETAGGMLVRTAPWEQVSEAGNPMAGGAFTLSLEASGPRFFFVPDRGEGVLYTYAPISASEDLGPEVPLPAPARRH